LVPDLGQAIETPLNKGLSANKNTIPDLEGFQVPKMNPASYSHSVPKLSGYGSPDCPSH
jgi:hypothetical protein